MNWLRSQFWGATKHEAMAVLFAHQGHRCAYCGALKRYKQMTLDHVMPLAVGGADVFENLLAVCGPCNDEKGAELPVLEFHEAIRFRVHSELREKALQEAA